MRIIAIVNQKGGCGKTTTAINLAAVYARRGLRTLVVDMDPQGHCACGLGVPEDGIECSIGEALLAEHDDHFDPSPLLWEVSRNLDLAPSTVRLATLEAPGGGLFRRPDRDRRLASLLARLRMRYDRCLIDCPPNVGLLTFNALRAAREALIPVETGFFSLRGARKQWATIQRVIERIGRPIACHILPTLHRFDSSVSNDILSTLRREFAGQIIPHVIRDHRELRDAASFGQPVIEYAPQSQALADLERIVDWLEKHQPQVAVEIEVTSQETKAGADAAPSIFRAEPRDGETTSDRASELARRVRGIIAAGPEGGGEGGRVSTVVRAIQRLRPSPPPVPVPPPIPEERDPPTGGVRIVAGGASFVQPGEPGHTVAVAGEFNGWSPSATPLEYDPQRRAYVAEVRLPPGRYQYRIVFDGRWANDRHHPERAVNAYGEANSVVTIPA